MSFPFRVVSPPPSSALCAEIDITEPTTPLRLADATLPIVRRIVYFIINGEPWRYTCNAWLREDADRLGLVTMPAPDNPDLRLESWEENLFTGEVVKTVSASEVEELCRKRLSLQRQSRH